jgi:hypothetical protein
MGDPLAETGCLRETRRGDATADDFMPFFFLDVATLVRRRAKAIPR